MHKLTIMVGSVAVRSYSIARELSMLAMLRLVMIIILSNTVYHWLGFSILGLLGRREDSALKPEL